MTDESEVVDPRYRIVPLDGSYSSMGMVLSLLSRHPPFSDSRLDHIAMTIGKQLRGGRNVAAVSPQSELLGYVGWVPTLRASAELWMEGRGPLKILEQNSDAVAITIVVSESPSITKALIRGARDLSPNMRWFFKRSYGGQFRAPRKQAVLNRSNPGGQGGEA